MPAIGTLEKSTLKWAEKLTRSGFRVEVSVFRSGPGGGRYYGESRVEVDIYHDDYDYSYNLTFVANDYGSVHSTDIGGSDGWSAMKAEAVRRLNRDLAQSRLPELMVK